MRSESKVHRFTWHGRRCLITGVGGFVGSHLAERLIEEEAHVFGVIRSPRDLFQLKTLSINERMKVYIGDVRDYEFLEPIFKFQDIDTCFHLAATSIVAESERSPIHAFQTNVMGTWNVLEAARNCRVERMVVASSDKAYGEYPEEVLPYREEYELRGTGIYSCSKACADMIAHAYFLDYKLPVTVTRCSNIYGPADPNLSRIIPGRVIRIFRGIPPSVFETSQHHIREYTYITDIINAYLLLAERIDETQGKAYNVGAGHILSTLELVRKIASMMGAKIPIQVIKREFFSSWCL